MIPAFPKPGQMKRPPKPTFEVCDDGREVCADTRAGREEYRRRTLLMRSRQSSKCCICGRYMTEEETTFEHWDGRGMGGGHRDDRIYKNGEWYNGAAHAKCNGVKGSIRFKHFQEMRGFKNAEVN